MSQNYYQSGNMVAFVGWDKPTQSAFVTLGALTDSKRDWDEPFLLSKDYPFDRENNMHHVDEIVVSIKSRLGMAGLSIPDEVYGFLREDIAGDSVNVTRIHFDDKEPLLYEGDPFADGFFDGSAREE